MEVKFLESYNKLNKEQKEAVDAIDGPVMVVAGPGTGKTQILTLRIANILRQTDTSPENILALTFTESGVSSMRKRLTEIIGQKAYRITINTFHGFCNEVIKNYPEEFPRIIGSKQINEIDQVAIIEKLIDELELDLLRPFGDRFLYARDILSSLNEIKREGIAVLEFEKLVKIEKGNFIKIDDLYYDKGAHKGKMKGVYQKLEKKIKKNFELSLIYTAYTDELMKQKLYDYNDMIMEVLFALGRNKNLLLMLQEDYQYILVDEHQDTNNAQNKIVELLMNYHINPNIFVVGDEKQAIFRFQGASLENFFYFKKLYPSAKLINLVENYRSTQSILDSAHSLISSVSPLRANSGHENNPIHLAVFNNLDSENYFLAQDIKLKIDGGTPAEEIAVLYRDNKDVFSLARMLEKFAIPYSIESDQDLFSDIEVRKIIILLRAVNYYGEDEYLAEALHLNFLEIPPLDVYKILNIKRDRNNKTHLYDLVSDEKKLNELGIVSVKNIVSFSDQLAKFALLAKNEGLLKVFEEIFEGSGFLRSILEKGNIVERLDTINSFFDELKGITESKPQAKLSDFFIYLNTLEKHDLNIKKKKTILKKGRVRLMTVHRSKGLEFEYVFIIQVYDGHFGSRRTLERLPLLEQIYNLAFFKKNEDNKENIDFPLEDDNNDDERRLFYVALTRAKKGVTITYSRQGENGREQLPCQFIGEIKKELIEELDLINFEKDFEEKKHILFTISSGSEYEKIDQEFVQNIFEKNGLSVTALNNYLSCPWNFFYSNLLRLPKAQNKHMLFGTAIHRALNDFFKKLKDKELTKENLLDSFLFYLNKQPLNDRDFSEVLEKGEEALAGFYDHYYSSWERNVITEFSIKGVDIGSGVHLNGNIDKIEFLDTENGVNVVDYKTGKPKTRNEIMGETKNSEGNYYRQLVFYKILLDNYDPAKISGENQGKYKMVSAELDFVEPSEKGEYKKERFFIPEEDTEELKEVIKKVVQEIRDLEFWDKKCDDNKCQYCQLRSLIVE